LPVEGPRSEHSSHGARINDRLHLDEMRQERVGLVNAVVWQAVRAPNEFF
jgi:hypothetical protein